MLKGVGLPFLPEPNEIPGVLAGGWYYAAEGATSNATQANNTLYYHLFAVRRPLTIANVGGKVTTAGTTSAMKIGIWRISPTTCRPDGLPLVHNNAGIATTSNGARTGAATGSALAPGVYAFGTAINIGGGAAQHQTLIAADSANAALLGAASAADLVGASGSTAALQGFATPFTYTDDISALNLTGASWTAVVTALVPTGIYQVT